MGESMNYKTISVIAGLAFWALWTIAIRTVGHLFFITENPGVMAILFAGGFMLLVFIARLLFRLMALLVQQVFLAVTLMVVPGMILDSLLVVFYAAVFPNMPAASGVYYGAWLLLMYAAVLVGALTWPIGKHREQHPHP
jgi:hypothetical protein